MFRFTCLVAENVSSLSAKLKAKAGRIFKPLDAHAHACFANLLYIYMLWPNFIVCLILFYFWFQTHSHSLSYSPKKGNKIYMTEETEVNHNIYTVYLC